LDDERRKNKRSHWFEIFEEFERIQRLMDDMFKAFEVPRRRQRGYGSYAYGFSISFKPDGKLTVRKLRDIEGGHADSWLYGEWEPLIDVLEGDGKVTVIAETLGVRKEEISLSATEDHLTISISNPQLNCRKEIPLPAKVDPRSTRATYKNGVLVISLKTAKRKLFRVF